MFSLRSNGLPSRGQLAALATGTTEISLSYYEFGLG